MASNDVIATISVDWDTSVSPKRGQLNQASLFEFHDGAPQSSKQGLALLPRSVFLQKHVSDKLAGG